MTDHDDVVGRVTDAYLKKGFLVQMRGNNLPQGARRTEAIYRPDILVKDRDSDAGKSVVGATILADVCMQIEMERKQQRLKSMILLR